MEQNLHSAASSLLFLDSGDKIGSSFSVSSRSGGQKWRPQRFISSPRVDVRLLHHQLFSSLFANRNIPTFRPRLLLPDVSALIFRFLEHTSFFTYRDQTCMRLIQQFSTRKLKALLPKPAGSGELLIMWATWSQILQSADFIFHQPSPRTHRT